MKPSKSFTVQEANEEVPRLTMLIGRLQRCALALDGERRSAAAAAGVALESLSTGELVRRRPAARVLIEELGAVVHDIERSGAQLKDVELGLVDFPGEVDGQPALLCWQFGESEVAFWHREGAGFAGRQPITGAAAARILQ
ncbi:MAG TPA: DUF2203 domain-containing protein [Gaiellaceae bacterium]|nr:DUF2203 domain-containing protein [Gaiellaceae bacterium]